MSKKEMLLDLLANAVRIENDFIENLSPEDLAAEGKADDWSARDMIAHCAYWKKRRVAEIPLVLNGGQPTRFDDFDHENDKVFQQNKDKSWDEVRQMSREAAHELIGQVNKMREADLKHTWQDDSRIWRMIVSNGYQHPIIHLAEHYQQKGDMTKAAELTALLGQPLADLDAGPGWQGTVKYNAACSLSLLGEKEGAIKELGEALTLMPGLVEWSKQDKDLDPLRDEPAFQVLFS